MNTMQKFLLSILLALIFCSASYSQQQPEESKKLLSSAGGPRIDNQSGAGLALTTDKVQYRSMEPVKVTIALKNTGERTFKILPVDVEWFYTIDVVGPDGKKLPFKKPRRSIYKALTGSNRNGQMVDEEEVHPRQTKSAVVWLSNLFDMSAPGSYKVTASTIFLLGTGGDTVNIEAKPITVEVTSTAPVSQWLD
ncbi:hypothetical protein B1R32_11248 [Abditibacterium utsteinense]|uniref:Intracellular proteinase inhibitor BsuPI domain-containing protein n=1 Tax=Abditibacterium utsteinense TaxID=1960156 RepID=A0A2S8SRF9_9BACT|nr:hypothetical protein [Abditibacterium utsteinense]PQV63393.1 hypothetical protein B1R32_11248 [Abditibacterium utsteinense]